MRVVVTGIGCVSALGSGRQALFDALVRNETGVRPLELFSLPNARSKLAAEVPAKIIEETLRSILPHPGSRADAMAIEASRQALLEAGLTDRESEIDVLLGGTTAGMFETEELFATLAADLDPRFQEIARTHPLSSTVDKLHSVLGPFRSTRTVCCACTSGAVALSLGSAKLEGGRSRFVLAGGADALCRLTYSGFGALGVLAQGPSRPFDKGRAGLNLGEGAAMLLLETEESAKARGARIIAELAGFAMASEAHHITNPEPHGVVASQIMRRALVQAGALASEVDYLNAHGTGTQQNDLNEAEAIRSCYADARVQVSSSKAQIGHTLGASGALEAVISVMAVERSTLPPSVGVGDQDPACDLDLVREARNDHPVEVAMSNSFGFGGTGASLVFARSHRLAEKPESSRLRVVVTGAAVLQRGQLLGSSETAAMLDASAPARAGTDAPPAIEALDPARSRRMDRIAKLTATVIHGALAEADGRGARPIDRKKTATLSGSAFGSIEGCVRFMRRVLERGASMASPADFPNLVPSSPASHASIYLGLGGPAMATPDLTTTAEASLAAAIEGLESGEWDSAVAGSVEEVSEIGARVLAPLLGLPSIQAPSEGGSAIVLETEESARARGATPIAWAELLGSFRGGAEKMLEILGRLPAPTEGSAVIADSESDLSLLRGTLWTDVPRLGLHPTAREHAAVGGIAIAAAVGAIAEKKISQALVIGVAGDRGHVFLFGSP